MWVIGSLWEGLHTLAKKNISRNVTFKVTGYISKVTVTVTGYFFSGSNCNCNQLHFVRSNCNCNRLLSRSNPHKSARLLCTPEKRANFSKLLYRRKTRWELTRISAAVMGIEFAYAAETAFVSPTLLKIGKWI